MKHFFVEITCYDGEHEHLYKAVGVAETLEEMQQRMADEQEYQCGDPEPEQSIVAFGDGLTGASTTVREISANYYDVLKQFLSEV